MQKFTINTGETKYNFIMTPQGMILQGAEQTEQQEGETRFIACLECGNTEQMPADMQRNHSQHFEHSSNTEDGEAYYICIDCHSEVKSFTE